MTTIAYRSGVLAAESLIAYNNFTNGFRSKIAQVGEYMVALAGAAWLREPLEQWVADGCNTKKVPTLLMENEDKFSTLIVDKDGRAYQFDNGYLIPVHADYIAIGSGSMLALGAMAHGASAMEAVAAAALHDKNSGGPIDAFHFSTLN